MKKAIVGILTLMLANVSSHAETQRKTLAGYHCDEYKVPVYFEQLNDVGIVKFY